MALLSWHLPCPGRKYEKYSSSIATTKRKDCHSCGYKQDSANSTADPYLWSTNFPTSWFIFENPGLASINHQDSASSFFNVQQIIRSSTSSFSRWNTNCLHPSSCAEATGQTSSPYSLPINHHKTIREPTSKTSSTSTLTINNKPETICQS